MKPGPVILKTARVVEANTIVLGQRNQGTLSRKLLGSVSDHVLHHARCAVAIYK